MTKEELYNKALKNHYDFKEFLTAEKYYKMIISEYPDSEEAKKAKVELQNLETQKEKQNFEPEKKEKQDIEDVLLTTIPSIEGYEVIETLEIISAECVYGMNVFKDFMASLSDVFGGRSKTTQTVLKDARKNCLNELKIEAAELGANAVIGVKLDYNEFSGQGKSMLFLVASGTAVVIKKKE